MLCLSRSLALSFSPSLMAAELPKSAKSRDNENKTVLDLTVPESSFR